MEKFEGKIKGGGMVIYDGYGVMNGGEGKEMRIYGIDGMEKGGEMKKCKVFKMIVLGGLVKVWGEMDEGGEWREE